MRIGLWNWSFVIARPIASATRLRAHGSSLPDNGRWAAFEVKLGMVEEGAATLRRWFAKRVDTSRCSRPEALAVITGMGYGYTRDDGVAVIPIGALGP